MSCRTVHDILEQARDERLPPLVQSALDAHLATCPDCARLAVLEAALASGLASVRREDSDLDLPADFRRRVKERLLASDRRAPSSAGGGWAWGLPAGLAAAACLAIAVVASFALQERLPAADGALASVEPATAETLVPVSANSPEPGQPLDLRTAPLLFATPEVEVLYGGRAGAPIRQVADVPDEADPASEAPSRSREYHF